MQLSIAGKKCLLWNLTDLPLVVVLLVPLGHYRIITSITVAIRMTRMSSWVRRGKTPQIPRLWLTREPELWNRMLICTLDCLRKYSAQQAFEDNPLWGQTPSKPLK